MDKDNILTGYRKDVPAFIQVMGVMVHASITAKPFGKVLIEGTAMGKPVVAAKMGEPLDIVVDGQTGSLVRPVNIQYMARVVQRVLRETLAEIMGHNGHDRVITLFTKERSALQVEGVYMHALGRG
jgi:glycosyltransferase involved in cell wall biosynthesis